MSLVELADHPWFVAVQFHPEFKSKPTAAHPLFAGLDFSGLEVAFALAAALPPGEPLMSGQIGD